MNPLVVQDSVTVSHITDIATLDMVEEPLTPQDFPLLKEAMIEGKHTDARNCLICQMLFGTGLRLAELLRITPSHVNTDGPDTIILIQRGKKKRRQWERLPLHPSLGLALRSYIQGNQIPQGRKVFDISARQVERIIKSAGLRAIGRAVHPHQFRKLYVKVLLDNGLPASAAARMVGHKDSRTTEQWYYDLSESQRHEINRRIPV